MEIVSDFVWFALSAHCMSLAWIFTLRVSSVYRFHAKKKKQKQKQILFPKQNSMKTNRMDNHCVRLQFSLIRCFVLFVYIFGDHERRGSVLSTLFVSEKNSHRSDYVSMSCQSEVPIHFQVIHNHLMPDACIASHTFLHISRVLNFI